MIGGFGGCAADRIFTLSHWPEPEGTAYIEKVTDVPGGMTLNALVAAARLGAPTAYLGALGEDEEGDFLADFLRREGVDLSRCRRIPGGETPCSRIMSDPQGRRTIFHKRGIRGREELEGPADLEGISLLLLDGSWMGSARMRAEAAAERGIPLVLDLSPNNRRPGAERLLELADYLILSRAAAEGWVGRAPEEEQARRLQNRYGGTAVVTAGGKGSWCAAEGELLFTPAFPVETRDSTGAGDSFHGAFAAALLAGRPLGERLLWASAAAALKCRARGHEGLPDRAALEAFLSRRGEG